MDIKNFILIGGGLLIAAVILHGLWIAWRARREPLRLDIKPGRDRGEVDEMELLRGELPNGGARVVGSPAAPSGSRAADPEQGAFQLEPPPVAPPGRTRATVADVQIPETQDDARIVPDRDRPGAGRKRTVPARQPTRAEREATGEAAQTNELVALHVINARQPYSGPELFDILREHGLKYGDMNIFHQNDAAETGPSFSVASAVEPGTFDLSDMDNYATPGLSFFMQLGNSDEPTAVFEDMLDVAASVLERLGGELKDEQMNVMTAQTVAHYRQRIAEFARKRLSARA